MTNKKLNKLLEVQYLKGRLDELYKGYVPTSNSTNNRMVDARISKYENKLKDVDIVCYHIDMIERMNRRFAKQKSKRKMSVLLDKVLHLIDKNDNLNLYNEIKKQLDSYK